MCSNGQPHFDQQWRRDRKSLLFCVWELWHVIIQTMHPYGIYLGAFIDTHKWLRILYRNRKWMSSLSFFFPFLTSSNFTGYHATLCMRYNASSNAHLLPVVKLPTAALHAHILMIETLWAQWDSFCSWSCSLSPFPLTAVLAVYAMCSV